MEEFGWSFPINDGGREHGINDSGIETFKGSKTQSLAREIIQNSLDAKIKNKNFVKVKFSLLDYKTQNFPDRDTYIEILNKCYNYHKEIKKAKDFFNEAIKLIKHEELKVLKISDFNTTGLTGSNSSFDSNWHSLIKGSGISNKSAGSGGSFGIGKNAPFACSDLRTIFYSTRDKNDVYAFQGVSSLVTHYDGSGNKTQGTGFYGKKDKEKSAITNKNLIPNYFVREKVGTDIFVFGYDANNGWKNKIIKSVIDNYFVSIYKNKLVVEVDDIKIDDNSLKTLINKYFDKNEDFYVNKYFETLRNNNSQCFTKEFDNLGELELFLLEKKNFPKKIAMVRETGMKIFDKGHFRTPLNFAGVLIVHGEKLNEELRKMEPPSHNDWEPERHPDPERAWNIRKEIYSWLNDKVRESSHDSDLEELNIEEISQYLPDELESDTEFQKMEFERLMDDDLNENIEIKKEKPINNKIERTKGNEENVDKGEEVGFNDKDQNEDGSSTGSGEDDGIENGYGHGGKSSESGHKNSYKKKLNLNNIRCYCLNDKKGIYLIAFENPNDNKKYLKIDIVGEDTKENADIKLVKYKSNNRKKIQVNSNGMIGPIIGKNGEFLEIVLNLNYNYSHALEVDVYED